MSEDNSNRQNTEQSKGQAPLGEVTQVDNSGQNTEFYKAGTVWEGKNNSIYANTVHGRMIIKSPTLSKALKEMREKEQSTEPEQNQKQSQNPSM